MNDITITTHREQMRQELEKVMDLHAKLAASGLDETNPNWWRLRDRYRSAAEDFMNQFGTVLEAALTVDYTTWQPWAGGECPVPADTIVKYRMRDGSDSEDFGTRAADLNWVHLGEDWDIISFRIAPESSNGA